MLHVTIRVKGQINEKWSEWFGGLAISPHDHETVLSGLVADSSALYGILSRLRDLGLELTTVSSQKLKDEQLERKSIW